RHRALGSLVVRDVTECIGSHCHNSQALPVPAAGPVPKWTGRRGRPECRATRRCYTTRAALPTAPTAEGTQSVATLERDDLRIRELLFSPEWPAKTDAEPDSSWQPIARERLTGATNTDLAQQLGVSSTGRVSREARGRSRVGVARVVSSESAEQQRVRFE